MITISLDEKGTFENSEGSLRDVIMIAGPVYDDKNDPEDAKRERSRIRNYFEKICQEKSAPYPQALHWGSATDNQVIAVKREYMKSLGEFLKNGSRNGRAVPSFDGKPRSGLYYVYAMVKSRKGKTELIKLEVSNLVNEGNASNLYMHMVEDTIARLLFYNVEFIDQREVALDLATRVYVTDGGVDVSAHTDIGYTSNSRTRNNETRQYVKLTNQDVFRTALERDMLLEEKENDIDVKSLLVRSINYYDANAGHEFLYMADAICTYLGDSNTYGINRKYLQRTWKRMAELTDDRRLLFSHDVADTYFSKAWRNVASGDIFNGLCYAYDSFDGTSEEHAFYKEYWEPVLCKRIIDTVNMTELIEAVRKLTQYTRSNNINQQKLLYLYERLKMIMDKSGLNNDQIKAVLYDLYDAGIVAYNHVGNPEKAGECAEKCKQYSKYISIERKLDNRNKIAVGMCDSFKYKEAEQYILTSYEYCEKTFGTQAEMFGEDVAHYSVDYGIVCSQLAQIYSYMRDDKAETLFHKALGMMEKDSVNYNITKSYLLHYYLQSGEKDKYESHAKEYFGDNEDLEKQLEYLITEGSKKHNPQIALKFALFVYIKGIATFYTDKLPESLVLKLADMENTIEQINPDGKEQINGHPWEIIYKYLAIIAYKNKQYDRADYYRQKLENFKDEKGPLIDLVLQLGNIELAKLRNPQTNISEKVENACEIIKQINPEFKNIEASLEKINEIVTYTYR